MPKAWQLGEKRDYEIHSSTGMSLKKWTLDFIIYLEFCSKWYRKGLAETGEWQLHKGSQWWEDLEIRRTTQEKEKKKELGFNYKEKWWSITLKNKWENGKNINSTYDNFRG